MSKIDSLFKIPCYAIGLGLFGLFAYLIVTEKSGAYLTLIAAALVLIMTRLPDIESLRLFGDKGLVTEMRKAVNDTQATLAQLHEVADLFARVTVHQIKNGGRWGGHTHKVQDDTIAEIVAALRSLDVDNARVESIIAIKRPVDRFDYFHYVIRAAHAVMNEEQSKAWQEYSKPFINMGIGHQPNPEATEAFLAEQGLLSGEVAERLADYKQYWNNGTHRRVELWNNSYKDA